MANEEKEFDLDELINQAVFWQKRVKFLAPAFYARGENAAAFNEAAEALNIWIVRLLTNHLERYAGSLKLDPKGTQNPWAENSPAIIRLKQGVINTQIPVRSLRPYAGLFEEVKRKMDPKTKVFKTNVESVIRSGASVSWALITGNVVHGFRNGKLVWEEVDELPKDATSIERAGMQWMVRDSIINFVRQQVNGRAAETRSKPTLPGLLCKWNVVIGDIIYRILVFKASVGCYKPTFVFVLEDTGLRESDTPEERRAKQAARHS